MNRKLLALSYLATAAAAAASTSSLVATIPVGAAGVSYEGAGIPEMLPYGPSALEVDPLGGFWVADAVGRRLLRVDERGTLVATISLGTRVATITDVQATPWELAVLDAGADAPQVLLLGRDGHVRERILIPGELGLRAGLSGLASNLAEVVMELEGGVRRYALTDGRGATLSRPEPFAGSQVVPADWSSPWPGRASILTDAGALVLEGGQPLGAVNVLATPVPGSAVALVEEVAFDGAVQVDVTVRKLDILGHDVRARVPAGILHVLHPVAASADGRAFALVTLEGAVEIRELAFSGSLEGVLPASRAVVAEERGGEAPTCLARTTMEDIAWSYRENWKVLSSTNISGTCTGRTKPRYLGSPGNYRSVSYDWGGWDTVSGWNSFMTSSYKAGDINTSQVESCSKGVDCSGFVSRCWQTSQKYGTSTLPSISDQLSSNQSLKTGDILNKAGSHVVLVDYITSSGVWAWESTTGGYDRVIWNYNTWSRYSTYVPRRYNNVCP